MSRIGIQPIEIPQGVTVKTQNNRVEVSGPKGNLSLDVRSEIKVTIKENQIMVTRENEEKFTRSLHGLFRTLVANMIKGVTEGFGKTLKIIGTGYRVAKEGEKLILTVGFSHPVNIEPPTGIKFEVEGDDLIKISGVDKALVGQIAATIRAIRPPEPYKGKGIRYLDEVVRHKAGKAGKVGAAGAAGGEK